MASESDWLEEAFEFYRFGRLGLEGWRGWRPKDVALEACIEDLHEALFDLKQAISAKEEFWAADLETEIVLIAAEIRDRIG